MAGHDNQENSEDGAQYAQYIDHATQKHGDDISCIIVVYKHKVGGLSQPYTESFSSLDTLLSSFKSCCPAEAQKEPFLTAPTASTGESKRRRHRRGGRKHRKPEGFITQETADRVWDKVRSTPMLPHMSRMSFRPEPQIQSFKPGT